MFFSRRRENTKKKDEEVFGGRKFEAPSWPDSLKAPGEPNYEINYEAEELTGTEARYISQSIEIATGLESTEELELEETPDLATANESGVINLGLERLQRGNTQSRDVELEKMESALSEGTVLEGKFKFDSPIRIDGVLRGEVFSSSTLVVGKNAEVTGHIQVRNLVICGQVWGECVNAETVEIRASGRLEADIEVRNLIVEKGGFFRGSCKMDIRDLDQRGLERIKL